ncbi:MAG: hypothetical protein JWR09_479 [Mucilaginibacter sp.]|nr:hypothetical protein [Mucilaginibacter sp.]
MLSHRPGVFETEHYDHHLASVWEIMVTDF